MKNVISFENAVYKENMFNPDRLRIARCYRGLTVTELANRLEIQRQKLSMYENNRVQNPEILLIRKISEELKFPVEFFLESNSVNQDNSVIYFRSLLTTNKKYKEEQIQKINFIIPMYKFLREYIEFPSINLPTISQNMSVEEAAERLRKQWNLGTGPINNLVYEAEKNGIIVTNFETATGDIDAYSKRIIIDGEERFLVGYSKNKNTAARIHFDVAHELGHMLLDDWNIDTESLSGNFKEIEKRAHRFAGAFLLPKEEFALDVGKNGTKLSYYVELKKRWKVSISAMILRSYALGLINQDDYQRLMATMTKRGIRKNEPLDDILVTSQPVLFKDAVNLLLEQNVLSIQEILEGLSDDYGLPMYPDDIESLLGLRRGTLKMQEEKPSKEVIKLKNIIKS